MCLEIPNILQRHQIWCPSDAEIVLVYQFSIRVAPEVILSATDKIIYFFHIFPKSAFLPQILARLSAPPTPSLSFFTSDIS